MPRGQASWQTRKQPVLDSHVMASVQAGMDERGHYGELVYTGCRNRERAEEIKRALFRSAQYLHRHKLAHVSITASIEPSGGEFQVRYHAIDKMTARRYVIERYGHDRAQWPYNPRSRNV